jgi:hypothetical protein
VDPSTISSKGMEATKPLSREEQISSLEGDMVSHYVVEEKKGCLDQVCLECNY